MLNSDEGEVYMYSSYVLEEFCSTFENTSLDSYNGYQMEVVFNNTRDTL